MRQPDSLDRIAKRTQRYWYQDGIWEIGFGLVNALLSVFYLLNASLQRGTLPSIVLVLIQMGVIFSGYYLISRVTAFLKERITYPRTGYVVYRKPTPSARVKRILQAALIAAGTAALVGIVAAVQMAPSRLPLIISVIFAGTLAYVGHRFELNRMYLVAVLTILLAYGISLFPLNEEASVGAFLAGFSLLMILSGGITLLIFMRSTRPASETDDYEAPRDNANG